jgi:hypothetical protein
VSGQKPDGVFRALLIAVPAGLVLWALLGMWLWSIS